MRPIIQLIPRTPQAQTNIEDIAKDVRIILPAFDVEVVKLLQANKPLTPVSENVEGRTIPLCECEHGSHFGGHPEMNHPYAQTRADIEEVKTTYATLKLCKDCRDAKHMMEVK